MNYTPEEVAKLLANRPNQPHYIVNASSTEPARLVVVMITPKSATALSEPLPK